MYRKGLDHLACIPFRIRTGITGRVFFVASLNSRSSISFGIKLSNDLKRRFNKTDSHFISQNDVDYSLFPFPSGPRHLRICNTDFKEKRSSRPAYPRFFFIQSKRPLPHVKALMGSVSPQMCPISTDGAIQSAAKRFSI